MALALRFFAAARIDAAAPPDQPPPPERLHDIIAPHLDAYLAREVLGDLPFAVRTWVLGTALMRWIDESACAAVAELANLHITVELLERWELFIETLPDGRASTNHSRQPVLHAWRSATCPTGAPSMRNWGNIMPRTVTITAQRTIFSPPNDGMTPLLH